MKRSKIGFVLIALVALTTLVSCEWISNLIDSRTRNIALITIYNSNREKTNLLQPNDTLYVEVQGLVPGGFYTVECLDPEGNLISKLSVPADANGVIGPSPLWYDVGFKKVYDGGAGQWRLQLATQADLGVSAFNIHVTSEDSSAKALSMTDFKLPFFVVFNTNVSRPQPIVMAGRMVSSEFYLENAFQAGEAVYVKAANLDSLPTPTPASGKARIYLMPFTGDSIADGAALTREVFSQLVTVQQLKDGVALNGTDNYTGASWTNGVIPNESKGLAYSVIVDVNDDGIYEIKQEGTTDYYLDGIDGNGVAGFLVIAPPPPPPPVTDKKYIPANIASGGTMGWDVTHSFGWWPNYDYRDEFKADGLDTRYAWDWESGSYGYGIKAIWNPYVNIAFPQVPNSSNSTLYYGRYVDVWIVENDATHPDLDLTGTSPLKAAHKGETYGTRKLTLPVQSACDNGVYQQNIWPAPMIAGDYCVVVDLDGDGYVSDYDIVDNVDSAGNKRTVSGYDAGFSVVP